MKKMLSIVGVFVAVLAGVGLANPANAAPVVATTGDTVASTLSSIASPSPVAPRPAPQLVTPRTGNYYYYCVLSTGNGYTMAAGEPLTDCHGTYLQKYLDGTRVSTLNLAYGGGAAASVSAQWRLAGCAVSFAGSAAVLIFDPPVGVAKWVLWSLVSGTSMATSCISF